MTSPAFEVDKHPGDDYPVDLYTPTGQCEKVEDLEAIDGDALARFREQGYLAIEHAFTEEEVREAIQGLLDLIDGKRPAFEGVQFEARVADMLDQLAPEEKQDHVRKLMWFVDHDSRLGGLAYHPRLTSILTRLIGKPPKLFQDMALLKPPGGGREKPWHQDHAYFDLPLGTPVVGVWIALDEATEENGCMHLAPGLHQQGPVVHFQRRDWQICDEHAPRQQVLSCPLKPGGCLLFHSLLPHGTPTNRSSRRRRALQFHYAPEDAVKCAKEDRLAVFGEEGKDVSC